VSESDSRSLQEEARLEEDEHERAFWDNPLQELVAKCQLCVTFRSLSNMSCLAERGTRSYWLEDETGQQALFGQQIWQTALI